MDEASSLKVCLGLSTSMQQHGELLPFVSSDGFLFLPSSCLLSFISFFLLSFLSFSFLFFYFFFPLHSPFLLLANLLERTRFLEKKNISCFDDSPKLI